MLLLNLFLEFAKISIFCVGGGYASMPFIQAIVVDKYGWLSLSEFVDIFTLSQMTPGPIGINAATFAGTQVAGLAGAVIATVGYVTPSLIICIVVARFYFRYGDIGPIRGILNGLRPAVVALIAGAALDFILLAVWDVESFAIDINATQGTSIAIIGIALLALHYRYGVIPILLTSGVLGVLLGVLS